MEDTVESKTVRIDNISCGHCVATIERELADLEGIVAAKADAATKELRVSWETPTDWATVSELLDDIGFPATA